MNLFCPECHESYGDASMRVCPADGTRLYKVDTTDPLIGSTIDGRFRVDYMLGVGGMGAVYGGVQLSVNRDVAIKVLRTELAHREVALERFFREAKTISKLSHPNIVKLVDFGQDQERDVLYLAMELVRGQNLGDLVQRGRMRTALALDVVYQVCGALTEPHADGVIHRDLKPDNLLLVPVSDGTLQVKVLDFGIARFMESNTQLTGTGMICGTPAYMAPEQAQNETLDARTDLYALGVILYEMLSGWPPFSGTSSLQIMLKHIQETPPRLHELLPPATLPADIEELVYVLMSKERTSRIGSAREVRDIIDNLRKKYDLRPLRLESERNDTEAAFTPFILPKLPRPMHEQSGPTQVLRRETGLQAHIVSNDTAADPVVGVTGPMSPDQELVLAKDAAIKVQTRGGGQQAWTPGDQAAVRSIKDTMDGVDVHGQTQAGEPPKPVRRTAVEDSESMLRATPRTEDAIAEIAPPSTITKESAAHRGFSTFFLLGVALVSLVAIGGAAYFIVERIDALKPPQHAQQAPPPLVEAAAVEQVPDPSPADLVDFVAASGWAQRAVHDSLAEAAEKKPVARKKQSPRPHVKPRPKTPVATPDPTKKATTESQTTDKLIDKLGLRKEDG